MISVSPEIIHLTTPLGNLTLDCRYRMQCYFDITHKGSIITHLDKDEISIYLKDDDNDSSGFILIDQSNGIQSIKSANQEKLYGFCHVISY